MFGEMSFTNIRPLSKGKRSVKIISVIIKYIGEDGKEYTTMMEGYRDKELFEGQILEIETYFTKEEEKDVATR